MEEAFAAFASDFRLSTAESMVKCEKRETSGLTVLQYVSELTIDVSGIAAPEPMCGGVTWRWGR